MKTLDEFFDEIEKGARLCECSCCLEYNNLLYDAVKIIREMKEALEEIGKGREYGWNPLTFCGDDELAKEALKKCNKILNEEE